MQIIRATYRAYLIPLLVLPFILSSSICRAETSPSFVISLNADIASVLKDKRFKSCSKRVNEFDKNYEEYVCPKVEDYIIEMKFIVYQSKVLAITSTFLEGAGILYAMDNKPLYQKLKEKNFEIFKSNTPENRNNRFETMIQDKGEYAEKKIESFLHEYENERYKSIIMFIKTTFKSDGSVNISPNQYTIIDKRLVPVYKSLDEKKKNYTKNKEMQRLEEEKKKYNF